MFLYNIVIACYFGLIKLLSVFNHTKAKAFIAGRNHTIDPSKNYDNHIWFHCASLGEYEQIKPILKSINKAFPKQNILLSFYSPSGFNNFKDNHLIDELIYLPYDTLSNIKSFIKLCKPKLLIINGNDIWINLITHFNKPIINLAANYQNDSFIFSSFGAIHLKKMKAFEAIFCINNTTKRLLEEHGFNNLIKSGNTRIDSCLQLDLEIKNDWIDNYKQEDQLIIIGSSYIHEATLINQFDSNSRFKLIIAPHEVDKESIKNIDSKLDNYNTQTLSEYILAPKSSVDCLIIDKIGMLKQLYKYSDIVIIGGGNNNSIHNTLEPAAADKPILFGPKYHKFDEAIAMLKTNAAFTYSNQQEFDQLLTRGLSKSLNYQSSRAYLEANKGTTLQVIEYLEDYLN